MLVRPRIKPKLCPLFCGPYPLNFGPCQAESSFLQGDPSRAGKSSALAGIPQPPCGNGREARSRCDEFATKARRSSGEKQSASLRKGQRSPRRKNAFGTVTKSPFCSESRASVPRGADHGTSRSIFIRILNYSSEYIQNGSFKTVDDLRRVAHPCARSRGGADAQCALVGVCIARLQADSGCASGTHFLRARERIRDGSVRL